VRETCERAARRFEELGCIVEEATPGFSNPSADQTFMVLAATADAVWLSELSDAEREQIGPPARAFLEAGSKVSGAEYVRATGRRMAVWQSMQRFHETYDLLMTPAVAVTAFPVGQPPTHVGEDPFPPFGWSPFTVPFNLTGQPAASVPCGFDAKGLPIGLQIVGRAYADAVVLRAARAFEDAQPWADRRPALDAVMAG
jgi:aspartyl-tRNA(Asn)/glutamyl-tRNA(Gln) amidotransferase subunit A